MWDSTRDEPLRTFQWGVDPVHCVQFNQVQTNLIGVFPKQTQNFGLKYLSAY